MPLPLSPMNRRETQALERLVKLIADGVAYDAAAWQASDHGKAMDLSRMRDLYDAQQRSAVYPGAFGIR